MRSKLAKRLNTVAILVVLSWFLIPAYSMNYGVTYMLLSHFGGSRYYRLNVAVSQSLYEYYAEKTHRLASETDFAKFVTPYALAPIADSLSQIYGDDEDLANGALMIVHQIPYRQSTPPSYPVETIAKNEGDCDLFSYVAASILNMAGLNVVLLYYEGEAHMNIGVNLIHEPEDMRGQAYYVTYGDARFYVAECTGGDWENGWRVGECPGSLRQVTPQVVTLDGCEQSAPAQVSAGYSELQASALTFSVSAAYVMQGSVVTLSGQLTPALPNQTITIYMRANSLPWQSPGSASTDANGRFMFSMIAETAGICGLRASWSGNEGHASVDSETQTLTVMSTFFISLLGLAVALVGVGAIVFFLSRQSRHEVYEPQPPATPL